MDDLEVAAEMRGVPTTIAIDAVRVGEGLRVEGINQDHVKLLLDYEGELPPILVQKSTMQVIDGAHRLYAARAKGATEVTAQLINVSDATAFLYGVTANIAHGLPLSLADRKAAAERMARLFPDWSDRALGRACGLSGKTVAALRVRSADGEPAPSRRVGLDGRARPVDRSAARALVREHLEARPGAPLREIAKAAGVSTGTAQKVRNEMGLRPGRNAGDKPQPPVRHRVQIRTEPDPDQVLDNLRRDPSIRYRAKGRDLLRLLHRQPVLAVGRDVIDAIPAHCLPAVARLMRLYAQEWQVLAGMLESRCREEAT